MDPDPVLGYINISSKNEGFLKNEKSCFPSLIFMLNLVGPFRDFGVLKNLIS